MKPLCFQGNLEGKGIEEQHRRAYGIEIALQSLEVNVPEVNPIFFESPKIARYR
jgi:hypothetical protein